MFLEQLVKNRRPGVVALEIRDERVIYYFHEGDGFRTEETAFQPFLLLSSPDQLAEFKGGEFSVETLAGGMKLQYMVRFSSQDSYDKALKFLKKSPLAWSYFRDLRQQALVLDETRLFGGMEFSDLRRLGIALAHRTSSAENGDEEIVSIALSNSQGGERLLVQGEGGERELLELLVSTLRDLDPDVIEGYNLCRTILPCLERRATCCGVALELGRGENAQISKRSSRFSIGDREINYLRYEIPGRQVVDTLHLAMFYDNANRDLETYELDYLAEHFHLSSGEGVLEPTLQEAGWCTALGEVLEPSYFYQASLLPIRYQDVILRGNGSCLEALLTGEYLVKRHSLPIPEASRSYVGGMVRVDAVGVFRNVWHCDVRSMYPSTILAEKWVPTQDKLGVFPRLLHELREFRLMAKDAMRSATDPVKRSYFQALQGTFKLLINSFYGYLGFSQGTFNDYTMASQVTARGREILTSMLEFLIEVGANVLEMDTDGIYFQPPDGEEDPVVFGQRIQAILPAGIEVELDSVYEAMFSYKSKNYALLLKDGTVNITGAALKSRGLEPFQRRFTEKIVGALLRGHPEEIPVERDRLYKLIERREIPLAELAKTEMLNDSPRSYKRKLDSGAGRRAAAYELALSSKRDYQAGDRITYYITGDKKKVSVVDNSKLLADAPTGVRDENTAYYLNKLDELYKNFEEFIPQNN